VTIDEAAEVSLMTGLPGATACELCTAASVRPTLWLLLQHPRGGSVLLAACEWCVQAIRRLSAATGGRVVLAVSEPAGRPPSALRSVPCGPRPASLPVLILELMQEVQAADGTPYVVRVYGQQRTDGTWEGWLEFVAVGAAVVLRTDRETTQSSREDLTYWATGLRPVYVQGAFARAQRQ